MALFYRWVNWGTGRFLSLAQDRCANCAAADSRDLGLFEMLWTYGVINPHKLRVPFLAFFTVRDPMKTFHKEGKRLCAVASEGVLGFWGCRKSRALMQGEPRPNHSYSQRDTRSKKTQEYTPDYALEAQFKKSLTKDLGISFLIPREHSLYKRANHVGIC